MRKVMLVISILCACVQGALANEPFGLELRPTPAWLTELRKQYRTIRADAILEIADQVRAKHMHAPLGWINQLVQLSPVIGPANECTKKATAKCEVARLLGLECNIVFGGTRAGRTPGHVMASIQWDKKWHMLDNQHVIERFFTPTDAEVLTGKNIRVFYPEYAYKY